jgi:hypothetical protein
MILKKIKPDNKSKILDNNIQKILKVIKIININNNKIKKQF